MRATSVICSSLIIMVFVWGSIAFAQQSASGPRIALSEETFDFKEVAEGPTLEHVFRVSNKGDQSLEINRVRSSRGCTVVRYDRTITPGGEGKIILRMETEGYEGILRKSAVVYSTDPLQPKVSLLLVAEVTAPISIKPRAALLKGFMDDDITAMVTIEGRGDKPLTLEPLLSPVLPVAYELETVEEGRVYQLTLRDTTKKEGKYQGFLTFKTSYPQKPRLDIRYLGDIRGELDFQPQSVCFLRIDATQLGGRERGKVEQEQSVLVTLNRGENLKIRKVETNEELFDVDVREIQRGKSYRIIVRLHLDRLPKRTVNESMRIYTNLKDYPTKVIPIKVQKGAGKTL